MGNAAVSLEDLPYRAHKFIFDKPLATRSPHLSNRDTYRLQTAEVRPKEFVHPPRTYYSSNANGLYFWCSLFTSHTSKYIHRESLDTDR